MNIAFLQDWCVPLDETFEYMDGIRAAVSDLTRRGHRVHWYTGSPCGNLLTLPYAGTTLHMVPTDSDLHKLLEYQSPEVILCWGSLDRPWHELVHRLFPRTPKVLCFAGGPTAHMARGYFRVVVVESKVYLDAFTKAGVTAMRGFGTNVKVFHDLRLRRIFDAVYPASLCFHKNIELFCRAMRTRGLVVGNHNEPTVASKVLQLGTSLMHRVNSVTLSDIYNMSKTVVVTAGPQGGAQRVVLEAMACGTPVVVMADHDRCVEFVEESGFGRIVPAVDEAIRDAVDDLIANPLDPAIGISYVTSKWTEDHYAASLERACHMALEAA